MNKQQWISIRLDGSVPLERICDLLDLNFELTETKSKKTFVRL
jgi:predicted DNA-binding protein (MmcQ/YjbR family)